MKNIYLRIKSKTLITLHRVQKFICFWSPLKIYQKVRFYFLRRYFKGKGRCQLGSYLREQFISCNDTTCIKGLYGASILASDYIRDKVHEQSFLHLLLDKTKITKYNLEKDLDDNVYVSYPMEPDSPGAKVRGRFDYMDRTYPDPRIIDKHDYIDSNRYPIPVRQYTTSQYTITTQDLYTMRSAEDRILGPVVANCVRNLDGVFIKMVDFICTDTDKPGAPHRVTGKVQWQEFTGGVTCKNMESISTMLTTANAEGKYSLPNSAILVNDDTARKLLTLKCMDGNKMFGMRIIYSLSIPDNTVYVFTEPEILGRYVYLDDWTMWMKKEAFMTNMFSWWVGGMTISNIAGVAKAVFKP